jgi:hypothetical protein
MFTYPSVAELPRLQAGLGVDQCGVGQLPFWLLHLRFEAPWLLP